MCSYTLILSSYNFVIIIFAMRFVIFIELSDVHDANGMRGICVLAITKIPFINPLKEL